MVLTSSHLTVPKEGQQTSAEKCLFGEFLWTLVIEEEQTPTTACCLIFIEHTQWRK